jgi:hypothetical protein
MKLRDRIWLLLSQAVNALWHGGHPDESLSARAWRERHVQEWAKRHERIDRWLGLGHCKGVHEAQRKREDARREVSGG